VVVRGVDLFPRMPSSFCSTVAVRAKASPVCRVALALLSLQVILLNFMGWIIVPSCYWAYAIRFWALVQSRRHHQMEEPELKKFRPGCLILIANFLVVLKAKLVADVMYFPK
jgi:hypothetical protein